VIPVLCWQDSGTRLCRGRPGPVCERSRVGRSAESRPHSGAARRWRERGDRIRNRGLDRRVDGQNRAAVRGVGAASLSFKPPPSRAAGRSQR
jgi:hypothetical protein